MRPEGPERLHMARRRGGWRVHSAKQPTSGRGSLANGLDAGLARNGARWRDAFAYSDGHGTRGDWRLAERFPGARLRVCLRAEARLSQGAMELRRGGSPG